MKLDSEYGYIDVCPVTRDQMSRSDIFDNGGICPYCGHGGGIAGVAHYERVPGRWRRPSLWEMIRGHKPEFFPKSEEDKVLNILKG